MNMPSNPRFALLLNPFRRLAFAVACSAFGVGTGFLGRAAAADALAITEIVADNVGGLTDEDGATPDWIEIHNHGPASVNLAGWSLTDDAGNLTKWLFPSIHLAPKGFLIVFASGKDRTNGPALHTNFELDAGGSYLALVHGANVVSHFSPKFPSQRAGSSYGLVQSVTVNRLVASNAPASVLVPIDGALGTDWTTNGFTPTGWLAATNGVGYETSVPGFRVRNFKANVTVDTLAKSEAVIVTPAQQTSVVTTNTPVINFTDSQGDGHYGNNLAFPGQGISQNLEDFVLEVIGTVTIPSAGVWTFGVNSDDGFRLQIVTNLAVNGTNTILYDPPRGPGDTLGPFNFTAPGDYPLRLVYYERGGGAEVELWAAQGSKVAWDNSFALVGDTANGGLAIRSLPVAGGTGIGYRNFIRTDVQSQMLSNRPGAYVRVPFTAMNVAGLESLYASVNYDDGMVAYLNGTEVARRNAPASPVFNSTATAAHNGAASEDINLTEQMGLLQNGGNVLAFHGLNDDASGADFLILGELKELRVTGTTNLYFTTPTPGGFNISASFAGFVADTKFSFDHGFYDAPITLAITCETPGATIRYTINGSVPTLANGFTYSAPLQITNTTTVRAAAFLTGLAPSDVDCQTYLFVEDIVRQSPTGQPPAGWPSSWGQNVVDYGMDPEIVTNANWSSDVRLGLKSLPTFSVVMNLPDMFDPTTGIYANPRSDEIAWERPCSLEMIFPDGRDGFQINCGIRIRGGFSRDPSNPKHAFRFFFRQEYGASKLRYPVFADAPNFGGPPGADEFNKLDLRTMQNYSWSYQNDNRQMCFRDQSSRDAQLAMGEHSSHGIFCHLYINGQYWGLFNTDERPEANFGETYIGGAAENYDAIKNDPDLGYIVEPTDGTIDAWFRLWQAATNGFASNASYFHVQGRNPDGTPNPAFENLIEVDNLIVYMLIILYGGNLDAPISNFLQNDAPNNWFGIRDRSGTNGGFRFVAHDSEHTLLDVNANRTGLVDGQIGVIDGDWTAGNPLTQIVGGVYTPSAAFSKSSPQYVWLRMAQNAEFRLRVADFAQKHCFNSGALTPETVRANLLLRSNEIYRAIVCESARWGDAKNAVPYTRTSWLNALNTVLNSFVPNRTTTLINQLRADFMFPNVTAPRFNRYSGIVSNGFNVFMTNVNPGSTLYYTFNGSDPRLLGGGITSGALTYSAGTPIPITGQTTIRARVFSNTVWSAIVDVTYYTLQNLTNLVVSEIMYNPPPLGPSVGDDFEFIELKNIGPVDLDLSSLSFTDGITFTFTNGTRLGPGQFIVLGHNAAQLSTNKYPGLIVHGQYSGRLDNNGERLTISHPLAGAILSFAYNDGGRWPIAADGQGFSIVPSAPHGDPGNPRSWRGSANAGGSPGADDPAPSVPTVLVTEVLAHSTLPEVDAVELYNPGPSQVNLKGWYLTDNSNLPKKYRFDADTLINAGQRLVIGEGVFNPMPGTTNNFSLEGAGEEIYLLSGDAGGADLTGYSDGFAFDASPAGRTAGRHLNSIGDDHYVLLDANTLNAENSAPFVGDVVIRQIMYHPPDQALGLDNQFDEFIELVNRTASPVPFFDPMAPTNTWHLRGGVTFDFPTNSTLAAGRNVVLVSFPTDSPAQVSAFRARYPAFQHAPIFGPYSGKLDNSSDTVELKRPDAPDTNGVPYYTLDKVDYRDNAPWPTNADGGGATLHRVDLAQYGNDPINWSGFVALTVTTSPTNWSVRQGLNATNTIAAAGTPPLTYQWRLHGTNLSNGLGYLGATTPSLIITNAQPIMQGPYTVLVTDANGFVVSAPAQLTVLVPPIIVLQPQSQTIYQGDPVTLTIALSNICTGPFNFVWRSNSLIIASNHMIAAFTNSITITNVPAISSTLFRYRCDVQSPLQPPQGAPSANALITTITNVDRDLDGLNDPWEQRYGLSTNNAADAYFDGDGDGMINLYEFQADTVPTNALSVLRVTDYLLGASETFNFLAVSNRTYSVQTSGVLPGVPWGSLTNISAAAANRTIRLTNPPPVEPTRFLRLVTPQQP